VSFDASDPQSWNRYAYVTNDPTNSIDPLGLSNVSDYRGWGGGGGGGFWGLLMGLYAQLSGLADINGGCTMDGAAASCGTVQGAVGAGAAFMLVLIWPLLCLCVPRAAAQEFHIKVLNGRNGKPITKECLNIWVGTLAGPHL
jgi:hypothetical protein